MCPIRGAIIYALIVELLRIYKVIATPHPQGRNYHTRVIIIPLLSSVLLSLRVVSHGELEAPFLRARII